MIQVLTDFYNNNAQGINALLVFLATDIIGFYIAKNPNTKAASVLSMALDLLSKIGKKKAQ